jgi:hypothetical protein
MRTDLARERAPTGLDVERVAERHRLAGVAHLAKVLVELRPRGRTDDLFDGATDELLGWAREQSLVSRPHAKVTPVTIELEDDAAREGREHVDALLEIRDAVRGGLCRPRQLRMRMLHGGARRRRVAVLPGHGSST